MTGRGERASRIHGIMVKLAPSLSLDDAKTLRSGLEKMSAQELLVLNFSIGQFYARTAGEMRNRG